MLAVQTRLGKRELLYTALIALALSGCGASQKETPGQPVPIAIAPAPETAAPGVYERTKSSAIHVRLSPEASTRQSTAKVLEQIHQTNLAEIELAKMAREKSASDRVRAFADQLVQDHSNLDQTVVAMAQKNGDGAVAVRSARGTAREEQKLKRAGGANFDKLFLQRASSDHSRLISKLQQYREDASDDELEALIDKTIPILEQHRELAQILMKKEQA
jgi:putative membrane protein